MADAGSSGDVAKAIGDPFGTLAGLLAGFVPEGPLRTLVLIVEGLCVSAAYIGYNYHVGLLAKGGPEPGSLERQDYDKLRAGLAGGNLAARLYAKWLTAFLDGVERFFGDKGMADRTLFPHAFGLKKPAPLWTAPAFDRCLLLALIYPVATIFVIWVVSGHVGPAEQALGLKPGISGWARGLLAGAIGLAGFASWRFSRTAGSNSPVRTFSTFGIIAAGTGVVSAFLGGTNTFAMAVLIVCFGALSIFSLLDLRANARSFGFKIYVLSVFFFGTWGFAQDDALMVLFSAFFGIVTVVELRRKLAIQQRWDGVILVLFLPAMILACLGAADVLGPLSKWEMAGPLLLFLGLLTLLNAPFDWASLGLTRALLRRGLELGGWWPYLLALVDACLAGVIIALLALTMVVGVQAFDELAVHGGGKPVLPLDTLFDGIAKNPAAPEYWWAYALLLSSMIPSIINLAIGGMALTRGIPWLARLLLQWIPAERAVPEYKRQLAAIGLTAQMFAGVGLGIAAQAVLAWGLIFHVMPWVGLDLLDMARAVAAFDLPARIGQVFIGLR